MITLDLIKDSVDEGDFDYFKKLRDGFLFPVPSVSVFSLNSEADDDF